jgi:hypothetical protein
MRNDSSNAGSHVVATDDGGVADLDASNIRNRIQGPRR